MFKPRRESLEQEAGQGGELGTRGWPPKEKNRGQTWENKPFKAKAE